MSINKLCRGRYMRQAWRYDIRRCKRRQEPGVLTGVRNIARYMQVGAETFYKLHARHDLPAMRLPDGRWSTSKNLIDDWIVARWKAQMTSSEKGVNVPPLANTGLRGRKATSTQGGMKYRE